MVCVYVNRKIYIYVKTRLDTLIQTQIYIYIHVICKNNYLYNLHTQINIYKYI